MTAEPMQQPEATWAARRSQGGSPGHFPPSFNPADTISAADRAPTGTPDLFPKTAAARAVSANHISPAP